MLDEPRAQGRRDDGGIFGLVSNAEGFLGLEIGLDVLEEGDGERVALVDIGHVAVEAAFGVFIGEEADVGKFPAEDCEAGVLMRKEQVVGW